MSTHSPTYLPGRTYRRVSVCAAASSAGQRELFKSEINDNYLGENARINNLQEVTLKLYLKDTPGPITLTAPPPCWLPVRLLSGTLGACDAPLKIKSSLIMQIIHLLYFQHNTSYKRHNLLPSSLCQRRTGGWATSPVVGGWQLSRMENNYGQLLRVKSSPRVGCLVPGMAGGRGQVWAKEVGRGRHVSPGGVCLA